ncbi:MAG: MerR family transcriptional regulator [Kineosporiaceae bacterium]|nr:MerR family transcriptional regulator [Kineosporiaceae bacterium]
MSAAITPSPLIRIGELSRRVGVSEHTLRAWESRYGLLQPIRSTGGYRLYSPRDEAVVRRMTTLMTTGLSAAEAAETALAGTPAPTLTDPVEPVDAVGEPVHESVDQGSVAVGVRQLTVALARFDEQSAHAVLDRLFSELAVTTVLRDVVLPYLHDLGERWARGEASVPQEHFASNLIRGRLAALATGWGSGSGPLALVACPPREPHDLPLMIFGVTLHRMGWRVLYLGADTPGRALTEAAQTADPALVVLAATHPERFEAIRDDLRDLAHGRRLVLAGRGADGRFAAEVGATHVTADPVSAALELGIGRSH